MSKNSNRLKTAGVSTSELFTKKGNIYSLENEEQLAILADREITVKKLLIDNQARRKELDAENSFLNKRIQSVSSAMKRDRILLAKERSVERDEDRNLRFISTASKHLPKSTFDNLMAITFNKEDKS
tara:strand:+ start:297 stop:677 length:381 start_codon:yes stop_codon:yes gene_type:complete